MAAPARARAFKIEVDTALGTSPEHGERFLDALENARVDPALLAGAFATNVWGGRYEIDGLLKKGGQGTTFTGTDRKTGARVVLKMLDLRTATDWKQGELFDREVAALKSLDHERLPRFIDVVSDEEHGVRALVMTRIEGEPLDDILKRSGPLSEAELWRTLDDATSVLERIHGHSPPLVHRDIKPANLIRMPDGHTAVVDLGGIGHVRTDGGSTVVGTFGYMAPEQIYGAHTPRVDLYALGATLLALATAKEPEELPRRGLTIDVDSAAPHLSPSLRKVLSRLVAAEPAERPESALALRQLITPAALHDDDTDRAARTKFSDDDAPPVESEIEIFASVIAGIVAIAAGVIGTVLAVAIGEVLAPIILTIVASFSRGEQRTKLLEMRKTISEVAVLAREGLGTAIEKGVRTLKQAERAEERRQMVTRASKRAMKDRRKSEERAFKEATRAAERRRRR
jgi:serine/threonine protein kinase